MIDREKKYKLMYIEYLHLFCIKQKIKDDAVKIWSETNNEMYWVYKDQRFEKNEFEIIKLQVTRFILWLTVFIKDKANINRYYYLYKLKVSI